MGEIESLLQELESLEAPKEAKEAVHKAITEAQVGNYSLAKGLLTESDHENFISLRKLVRSLLRLVDKLESEHDHNHEEKEHQTGYQPPLRESLRQASFTESVSLLESEPDSEGDVWEAKIIQEGLNISGTREYTHKALQDIVQHMKQGKLQCFADHPTKESQRDLPERSIKDIIGWFTDPRLVGSEVRAKLHLLTTGEAALTTSMIKEAALRGNPDLVGISIRGIGDNETVHEGPRIFERVHSIVDLISADAVTRPGAGGKLISLAESENEELRRTYMDLANMDVAEILKLRPDLKATVEAQVKSSLEEEAKKAQEAAATKAPEMDMSKPHEMKDCPDPKNCPIHSKTEEAAACAQGAMKAGETPADQAMKKPVKEAAVPEDTKVIEESRKTLDEAQKILQEARLERSAQTLDSALASSKLPDPLKERVRKDLVGKVLTAQEIKESIDREQSLWDNLMQLPQRREYNPGVKVTIDEKENFLKRLDATIYGGFPQKDGPKMFRGIHEAYAAWQGTRANPYDLDSNMAGQIVRDSKGYKGVNPNPSIQESLQSVQESTGLSTSWSTILGDSIKRVLLRYYEEPQFEDWKKLCGPRIILAKDVKQLKFSSRGGYTVTPTVGEGDPYQERTFPSETAPTLSFTKYGDVQPVTIEAIINDDLGALQRVPRELAQAMKFRVYKTVFDILANNSTIYDSTALAADSRTNDNKGTTALASDEMGVAIQAMRGFVGAGATDRPLSLTPKYLIVPNELEELAYQITASPLKVLATNFNATVPNLYTAPGRYGMEVVVVDYWTDANNWWLVADPSRIEAMATAFYPSVEPELFEQSDETTGSVFTADKVSYKTRLWFGAAVTDYRAFYGEIVG